ncbi:MAG: type II secretion system F family protein [Actinomycetota bacterium]
MTSPPPDETAPSVAVPVRVLLVGLFLAALVAVIPAGSAGADTTGDDPGAAPTVASRVIAVDAVGTEVETLVFAADTAPDAVTVFEGGEELAATTSSTRSEARETEIVYVVDIDNRTVANGVLNELLGAVDAEVGSLGGAVRVGAVSAGAEASLVTRLTTEFDKPVDELRALAVEQGSALIDAVILAGASFSDRADVVRTVVVLTAGVDTASVGTVAQAETVLLQQGAQLVSVSLGSTPDGLARLAERTGGTSLTAGVDAMAARVGVATGLAADRLVVTYPSTAESGERPEVAMTIGTETLRYSYPAGVETANVLQLVATTAGADDDGGLFGHPIVLYLSIALAFVAISGGLWALASMYAGGESSLDKVLARYADQDTADLDDAEVQEMLVQTALIQRAVAMTESFAERRGFLTRVEEMLERANVPIRAGEAMFFLSIGVVAAIAGGLVATGSLFVAVLLGLFAVGIGYTALQLAARRRLKAFEAQLPDTLQLLAGTLRAGYSLPQGVDAVSHEIDDPMGHELRRAMTEAQLGRELDEALANIAERLDSGDFAWAVMAIGIQREVGGNLAEVLLTVADTMIQRERLKREVNALTAEGRVSAAILAMLPPGLGVVMWVMNPSYVGVLFSRTIGLVLIGLAVVSGLIGLAWMKKVITIDA